METEFKVLLPEERKRYSEYLVREDFTHRSFADAPGDDQPVLPELGQLRWASHIKKARTLLSEPAVPTPPLTKLWDVDVYDGWACLSSASYARAMVRAQPDVSLREVQEAILHRFFRGTLWHPHIWRIAAGTSQMLPLWRDALNLSFIQVEETWQQVFSFRELGGLVGAKNFTRISTVQVPKQGYFFCWQSEWKARCYALNRLLAYPTKTAAPENTLT